MSASPIPYGKQFISEEDINEVVAALKSDYLTQGPRIQEFEKAFAAYVQASYAVAVSNGTAALHLCALALGVEPGQKVITTPLTFSASANCVRYCGGEVVFADIDPDTWLIDPGQIRKLISASPKGTYSGIIPVDFSGRAVDLEIIRQIADDHGLWIIEDACHAPGGYFLDSKGNRQGCGNGKFADLAIFSFHPVKHIASGEGGMITTNDKELYEKLTILRTHGITRNVADYSNTASFASAGSSGDFPSWYMEMQTLGYNYRLTDIQAALGKSQLKRADEGLKKRRGIAARYEAAFKGASWLRRQSGLVEGHAYHLYVLEAENRLGLYNHLRAKNIFPQIHYIPVHLMPYYRGFGWKEGDFPNAEKYYEGCISLPMYPTLTDTQQDFVIETVNAFYKNG